MSSDDGRNHRPRKSFVANASGREIKVQRAAGDGESVSIQHGETYTIQYEDVKITCGDKNHRVKPEQPRKSIIVFADNVKITGQLHGVNIEEKKWIVDGENHKPLTFWQKAEPYIKLINSIPLGSCVLSSNKLLDVGKFVLSNIVTLPPLGKNMP